VTMSTVGIPQSPGTLSLSPLTVSRERFGSAFVGRLFAQMHPYVTLLSRSIGISLCVMNTMVLVPGPGGQVQ